jgi:hypothetical protein
MASIPIAQALYGSHAGGGYRFLARSADFREEWLQEVERLCMDFGERPAGVACPSCLFVQPLGRGHVAIFQVADQGTDDAGRPGALAFYVLVLPAQVYAARGGDPFSLADYFPPRWEARGELPSLELPSDPPTARTVAQVQKVLQRPDGPELLGSAQALMDGGRVVFERQAPDTELVRSLWTLLPYSTRTSLWPASFAFANHLDFHVLVTPRAGEDCTDYLHEAQAGEYPEGRYELALQIAAEDGDQAELDALFHRASRKQIWKLGLFLLGILLTVTVALNWLPSAPQAERTARPAVVAIPDLPSEEQCQTPVEQQEQVLKQLRELADVLHVPPATTAAALLADIDAHLGTPDPKRDPGPLQQYGPVQRQLRALLWKHQVAEYADLRLNTAELVERLQRKVTQPAPRE